MKNQLATAIAITAAAFENKTDKAGKPYILHCLRVMHKLHSADEELNAIAVMHDLIEDCPTQWSISKLCLLGFSHRVYSAVDALTHRIGESYEKYIERISLNPDATAVKLADLRDNSNITRLKGLTKSDFERVEKYHKAYVYLSKI